jgi:predicted porin
MKRISLVAITAVAGLFSSNVLAADLGGDCCADLEERVAELEATTARKGNRKVSLTIYGQVTTALMFWDADQGIEGGIDENNLYVVDPQTSGSRFGFKGKASINGEWSAGYHFEFQWQNADATKVRVDNDEGIDLPEFRQAHWWIKSKNWGKIRLGQADTANSGIAEINVANSNIADGMSSSQAGAAIIVQLGGPSMTNFEFNRRNVIRYDTPTFGGFFLSTAYGEDDLWDVALRFAGEHHGFKMAAGIAYGIWTDTSNGGNGVPDPRIEVLNGGLSVKHVGTGLFFTGSAGYRDRDDSIADTRLVQEEFVFLSAGLERKFLALGKSTFFGMGGYYEDEEKETTQYWGLGAVQKIDAAAMDLFISYRHYDIDGGESSDNYVQDADFDTVVAGGRIKF